MHQMRVLTKQVSSVVLEPKKLEVRKKNVKSVKSRKNQILCHEIEPNPSKERAMHEGDNPSFLDEFMKFYFLLDTCSFIHIRIFQQIPKYLATGL